MIIVQTVSFGEEITFTYAREDDLRDVGGIPVIRASQITTARGHPSFPEIGELYDAAVDAVRDMLADFDEAGPWQPPLPFEEDDEDEEGMGA